MIVPLTSTTEATSTSSVGGKASSLAKLYTIEGLDENVPKSYALSTSFFQPWVDQLNVDGADEPACDRLKTACLSLPLNSAQQQALNELSAIISGEFNHGLAAVRSSAVEEDGGELSYAGMFETELGVTSSTLESAVRKCFASKFDHRVISYAAAHDRGDLGSKGGGFAVVVMEMIDSVVAGVSFSANPLNSDRDECVIDSSFGLGESVVDGSVTADRFIYDKVQDVLISKSVGKKTLERRLMAEGGGVKMTSIDSEERQMSCSLTDEQVKELVRLMCLVEAAYEMPVDVEWAYDADSKLVLLQARPITTLYQLDEAMMTKPGEARVLYFDSNITQDATTTEPFTHMDMELYCRASVVIGGVPDDVDVEMFFNKDPTRPLFCGETRQYMNMSMVFKYRTPEQSAKGAEMLCPYTASLYRSADCDREKYRMKNLPKGVNLTNTWKLVRQMPIMKLYKAGKRFEKEPEKAVAEYKQLVEQDLAKVKELELRGYDKTKGLREFSQELFVALQPSMEKEAGALFFSVLGTYKAVDAKRREETTQESRDEYDALCSGFEGDELMEINIAVNQLANKLGPDVWHEYSHDNLPKLVERIEMNVSGASMDLPSDFISGWSEFLEKYGWDRDDQMFVSSPSYRDDPVFLLTRLKQNVGMECPSIKLQQQVAQRRKVMELHEERAATSWFSKGTLKKIKKRNLVLDHLMWMRNAPKLHISRIFGILRMNILEAAEYLLSKNMLDEKTDIFHLDLEEVDEALAGNTSDLMAIVRPRKVIYERAKKSKQCPILVDSRCRILRPDPPSKEDVGEGVLLGAAVAPGTATGKVRIVNSPADRFEQGEVLAAVVTSPAWTPLFAGASAVILQMGGALQHGALCAREFGKPAVSSIDIHTVLKTGMLVTVNGDTGTVKIMK